MGCPVWAALIVPTISPCGLVHGLPTWAWRGTRGQKNIQPIWAAYIVPTWVAQMGNPDCAHNRPARTSSWAAHLGLTWSPRPKNIQPIWAAYMGPTKMPIWVLLWVHMGMLAGHSVVTLGRPFMTSTDPRRRAISAGEYGSPQMRWAAYVLTRWAPCPIGHWAPRVKKKWTQLKS